MPRSVDQSVYISAVTGWRRYCAYPTLDQTTGQSEPPVQQADARANNYWQTTFFRVGSRTSHGSISIPIGYPRGDFRIPNVDQLLLVQPIDGMDRSRSAGRVHSLRIRKKQDRIALAAKLDALVHRWQKSAAPCAVTRSENLTRNQNDITG